MRGSHNMIVLEKGGLLWKGGVDSGVVAYSCWKEGYILGDGRIIV